VRLVSEPIAFPIVCHGCETQLLVEVTKMHLNEKGDAEARGRRARLDVVGIPNRGMWW
jgi:hypothetical protein